MYSGQTQKNNHVETCWFMSSAIHDGERCHDLASFSKEVNCNELTTDEEQLEHRAMSTVRSKGEVYR